jgi:hypothetical protein
MQALLTDNGKLHSPPSARFEVRVDTIKGFGLSRTAYFATAEEAREHAYTVLGMNEAREPDNLSLKVHNLQVAADSARTRLLTSGAAVAAEYLAQFDKGFALAALAIVATDLSRDGVAVHLASLADALAVSLSD